MSGRLRALIVEDLESDALLVARVLRRGGYELDFQRVDNAEAMRHALAQGAFDVVISDHAMPGFTAALALAVLRESKLDLPFLVVSGAIGEETAVSLMKAGAHDYLMKDNLARLIPAIERELAEAAIRRERRRVQDELRVLNAQLEQRVADRTAELEAANVEREHLLDQLQRTNRDLAIANIEARERAVEAQRQAAELDAVIESLAEGLAVVAPGGELLRLNDAGARLMGFRSKREALARRVEFACWAIRSPDGRPLSDDERPLNRVLSGEPLVEQEILLAGADGVERRLRFVTSPVRDERGEVVRAVGAFRDVTEERQAEQLRQEYTSLISHDLRNPLTSIIGMAQLVQRLLERQGIERESRSLDTILRSAERMNAMIEDLVESARLESGQLSLNRQAADLAAVVREVVDRLGTVEERARVIIDSPAQPAPTVIDAPRIERAIVNLVSNALKYSPPDSPVIVRLEPADQAIILSVADRGVGIPPLELPYLFSRFYRAKTGKHVAGLGLGLYITRLIVEGHGGQVWVESVLGEGSTFFVMLPRTQAKVTRSYLSNETS